LLIFLVLLLLPNFSIILIMSSEVKPQWKSERAWRSVIKALSWRIIASITTFILALLIFGNDPNALEKATGIALLESVIKMALYFFHERLWINISWGLLKTEEDE
jgi:uncharacterized membrane protein